MDPVRFTIAQELMLFIGLCVGMRLISAGLSFVATRWLPGTATETE